MSGPDGREGKEDMKTPGQRAGAFLASCGLLVGTGLMVWLLFSVKGCWAPIGGDSVPVGKIIFSAYIVLASLVAGIALFWDAISDSKGDAK